MGEDFAVLLCLFAGEFVVLAADGEVVLVFGLGGLQIGLYARDGGVKILLREFAFPYGDDGSGEGVEALGVEFVAGDVAGHFLAPELLVGLGNGVLGATPVAVPEAAVDEDVGAILRQDEIGVTIRNKQCNGASYRISDAQNLHFIGIRIFIYLCIDHLGNVMIEERIILQVLAEG